ncbi:poly(A)-binding protein binding protein [Oleoguttula sp. CCFEE 5521]
MSAATVNGDNSGKASGSKPQQSKSSNGRALEGTRKQAASPVDGQNKKQTSQPPKAWQGPNPITQRTGNQSSMHNGIEKPLPKLPPQSPAGAPSDTHIEQHAHDRLLFLLAHSTGTDATLTLKNGEQFSGVFSGASLEAANKSVYILKMAKRTRLPSSQQLNGERDLPDEYIGEGEDHMMTFDVQDTIDLAVSEVILASAPTQNGMTSAYSWRSRKANTILPGSAASSFRTDTEISTRNRDRPVERELQPWSGGIEMSLDDMALESSGDTKWDQFAVNEEKFGTQTTYDEDEYTTTIDRSRPEYARLAAQAERIEREIFKSTAMNSHVAEERGQNVDEGDGLDEEDKYSGVRREAPVLPKGAAGSYVPPSRRPLTNVPTVPGAPYDPAIISLEKPAHVAAPPTVVEPARTPEPITTPSSMKQDAPEGANDSLASTTQTPEAAKRPENTTEDHVRGTADAFKQFANTEKLRMHQAREQQRMAKKQEKNVKINDLKKFAENFKLKSRVPDDLVPILAKDHEKQAEIKRKAESSALQEEVRAKEREKERASATPSPQKQPQVAVDPQTSLSLQHSRTRVSQNLRGGPSLTSPRGFAPPRGQNIPYMGRQPGMGPQTQPLPADIRIPTGPMARDNGPLSPASTTSATNTRYNVNAKEFKFTPGVSSFTPSGASPSPQRIPISAPVPETNATFFDEKDNKGEMPTRDVNVDCDTIKRLLTADYPADHKKSFINGIPQPFRTPPTWPVAKEFENKSFLDAFPKPRIHSQGPTPRATPIPAGLHMQHQLPQHPQHHGHTPLPSPGQRPPFFGQQGSQHGQQFDHRMQYPGGPGSVQNSPRYAHAQMAGYGPQMGQGPVPQMPQFAGQQGYGMSPGMQFRQMQAPPGGPMMMMPQQHQQSKSHTVSHPEDSQLTNNISVNQMRPNAYPQPGPNGPNAFPPNMHQQPGAHMMSHSSSNSSYHPNNLPHQPQQGYSPMPQHAQPNGYAPSPRPGAQMMQHSGSHQGFQPPHQGQGGYGQGPPQFMRNPSGGGGHGGYAGQMTPRGSFGVPQQQGQPGQQQGNGMSGPGMGDEGK